MLGFIQPAPDSDANPTDVVAVVSFSAISEMPAYLFHSGSWFYRSFPGDAKSRDNSEYLLSTTIISYSCHEQPTGNVNLSISHQTQIQTFAVVMTLALRYFFWYFFEAEA